MSNVYCVYDQMVSLISNYARSNGITYSVPFPNQSRPDMRTSSIVTANLVSSSQGKKIANNFLGYYGTPPKECYGMLYTIKVDVKYYSPINKPFYVSTQFLANLADYLRSVYGCNLSEELKGVSYYQKDECLVAVTTFSLNTIVVTKTEE